ncbi:glycoside hydrolase family 32 protein [Candidatus Cetobacterium colombiensis]|uniref:Sucrose-6-phosphate hydrolase n=1 Tax=Candidatus Cetobacterium colombiensis TaxID=3073100 RepID=A0ABU4W8L0_9FUSO|nr:sucrose-6-phosphate hydrolase [Candidatus Cetobacterium colombiensis]MDX8334941.1 sucrose-6-phosphate hydrolase [Candidatus Cetobacterium colombiensis]
MEKRPLFHFTPESNWMNDPNGLCFYKGEYHIFYQHNPENCYWGNMTWGHGKSKNLFDWERLPHALKPDSENFGDIDGCFSGSAFVEKDELYLFYTGVKMLTKQKNEFGNTITIGLNDLAPTQILAKSEDGINFEKLQKLSLEIPEECCKAHVRDPKIWKKDEVWYMIIGARENSQGEVLVYNSKDMENWNFLSKIKEENMGYMWECPDLFSVGEKDILFISPEGVGKDEQKNISGYYLGEFNYETGKFIHEEFERLDYGFEFYAPQSFLDDKGRRVFMGWLVNHAPLPEENWTGMMTLPREIKMKDGKLYTFPVEELKKYRAEKLQEFSHLEKAKNMYDFEIVLENLENFQMLLFKDQEKSLKLSYSKEEKSLVLDRSEVINSFEPLKTFGTIRKLKIDGETEKKIRVIADKSVVEIYINDGELVMSSVLNPTSCQKGVEVMGNILSKEIYTLKR